MGILETDSSNGSAADNLADTQEVEVASKEIYETTNYRRDAKRNTNCDYT